MNRLLKILLSIVVIVIVLNLALSSGLSYYDAKTREKLLKEIAGELPSRASNLQISEFMRLHTTRFALNTVPRHEYVGFVPQTKLDKILFDRKVQIVLELEEGDRFRGAEVRVYYTGQ